MQDSTIVVKRTVSFFGSDFHVGIVDGYKFDSERNVSYVHVGATFTPATRIRLHRELRAKSLAIPCSSLPWGPAARFSSVRGHARILIPPV